MTLAAQVPDGGTVLIDTNPLIAHDRDFGTVSDILVLGACYTARFVS